MEWRCEWCGKPHAEDDPPCDNCGHGTFERAVVQQPAGPAGEDGDDAGATTTVWVCPECGRGHPKNAPPCSRCGDESLELEERSVDEYGDVGAPSYRDLLTPTYAVGLVAALGLAAIFVAGVTGIVTIPGLTPAGLEVNGVPGNASVADGIDLSAVESAYLDALDDRREEAGLVALSTDESMAEVATFVNQRYVKDSLTDDELPDPEPAAERLGDACSSEPVPWQLSPGDISPIGSFEDAEGVAGAMVEQSVFTEDSFDAGRTPKTGVDVHVGPDGSVYAIQLVC
jgi:hypothetical protein